MFKGEFQLDKVYRINVSGEVQLDKGLKDKCLKERFS